MSEIIIVIILSFFKSLYELIQGAKVRQFRLISKISAVFCCFMFVFHNYCVTLHPNLKNQYYNLLFQWLIDVLRLLKEQL